MPIKNCLTAVLFAAVAALAAGQEQPTPYDLIRPVWPLTWDSTVFSHFVPDAHPRNPLPKNKTPAAFAPNEIIPDTLDQAFLDAMNYRMSPIRVNQAGYLESDPEKQFYYIGSATTFEVVDADGNSLSPAVTGTLTSSGKSASSSWKINAGTNAATNYKDRYSVSITGPSGTIQIGQLGNMSLPTNTRLRIKVGDNISSTFIISEKVYSMVKDAALKFYGINRSGNGESWFHPASHTLDGGASSDSGVYAFNQSLAGTLEGGYYDCGDHLKESQTQMYAFMVAAVMAATNADADEDVYAYNQGETVNTDGIPDMLREAKHGADFVLRAYKRANGVVDDMALSVGDFGSDHGWWGRPENQDKLPMDPAEGDPALRRGGPLSRTVRLGEIGANIGGETAAGLALVGKLYAEYPEYKEFSDSCLMVAEKMYVFAKSMAQGHTYTHNKHAAGWSSPAYNGNNEFYDDMALASVALLYATGKKDYADDMIRTKNLVAGQEYNTGAGFFDGGWFVTNNKGFFKDVKNTGWANAYSYALYALYKLILADKDKAINEFGLSETEWLNAVEDCIADMIANLGDMSAYGETPETFVFPTVPNVWKPSQVTYDKTWYTMLTDQEWIYNRYRAGDIFEILAYADVAADIEKQGLSLPIMGTPNWKAVEAKQLGINQLNYLLGVNPWDISFIMGVGDKNDAHPHHRAANPEGKNFPGANYKYKPPVGALYGGVPPSLNVTMGKNGQRNWEYYEMSEVCIDAAATLVSSVSLASQKIDRTRAPNVSVEVQHVSMDSAVVVIKLDVRGKVSVNYGTDESAMTTTAVPDNDESGVRHEVVLRNLQAGTTYYFFVGGFNAYNEDNFTAKYRVDSTQTPFSFTTLNTVESADIQNVTVCNVSADTAEIMWYTPNGEYESRVYWDTVQHANASEYAFNSGARNADVSGVPTKFHYVKIGGLKERTQYYFMVESNGQFVNVEAETGAPLKFTTPVTQYDFSVKTYQYPWQDMAMLNINVYNNEARAFDSLTIRLYMRGTDDIATDIGMGTDICQAYDEAGFNKPCSEATKEQLERSLRDIKPEKIEDTYDAATGTWQWYFPLELGSTVIKSSSRLRFDVRFDHRSPWPPYKDLMNEAPNKKLYCLADDGKWYAPSDEYSGASAVMSNPGDWSWMPHSKANGDYADYPGMPCINKDDGDTDFDAAPVNPYVAVYRKDEFVWGYSPSKTEMTTKRAEYKIDVTYDAPFNVSNGSYVEVDQTSKTVYVTGHAHVSEGGYITQIWANGTKLSTDHMVLDNESYLTYNGIVVAHYNMATDLWDLNIPVRMDVGSNKIDITVFAGPDPECAECSKNGGCAFENRNYYVMFNRPNLTDGVLTVKDADGGTVGKNGVVDPDSKQKFYVYLTDKDKMKTASQVTVNVINGKKQDTLKVKMEHLGDGVFRSSSLITAVPTAKGSRGANEISFFAGDTIYVEYQDPDDEEDYSRITAFYAESNYPTPQKVLAMDSDCDNKADKLVVYFSNVLDETYAFTQMKVFVDGMKDTVMVSVPQPVTGLSEVTVPLADSLGVATTASPSGGAVVYLTNSGTTTEENVKISDGIAPQLLSVTILENPGHEAEQDTVMIAFTEPVEFPSLTTWPLDVAGVPSGATLTVVGKATTTTDGKSWQFVVTGNDNGAYIPVGGKASIKSGINAMDKGMNAVDPAAACTEVIIAETPKPVPVKLAEMRDFEGDGFADEVYILFEKKLRPKDMLDSFVVDWGMNSTVKSFVTKSDTSTGKIVPKDKYWTITDSLSEPYEKWLDSATKVTAVDTFSVVKISLSASKGFEEGLTSGAYDGYGHITPRLGPEGGFFDKFYFVVDRCPPVLITGKADTSGSFTNLTVTASEPLVLLDNEQFEYIERMRGGTAGTFLRSAIAVKQSGVNQMYTYNSDNDDAIQAGDSIRLPISASRYKDVAGNLPTSQNPWRLVSGAMGKIKFEVILANRVTRSTGDVSGYGSFQPAAGEYFRISALKDGKEHLANLNDGLLSINGAVVDSLSYRHSGPTFLVNISLPTALAMDTADGTIANKFDLEVSFSIDVFDNLGQFINTQEIRIDPESIRKTISSDGVLHLSLEWLAHDGEAPESKKGKKIGTGAYISKFNFKASETNVKSQETKTTKDDTTKTFGFKRAKRK